MSKVVEFPKKLEWEPQEAWVGRVSGTRLVLKVEPTLVGSGFNWSVWNGPALVGYGSSSDAERAKEEAKEALERGVLVVRPLPST